VARGVVDPVDPKVFGSRIMSVILGLITWQARICLLFRIFPSRLWGASGESPFFGGPKKRGGVGTARE